MIAELPGLKLLPLPKDDVTARCESGVRCPPGTYGDIDRGETLGTISTIAFAVVGLGAVITVFGLLNPTRTWSTTTVRWRPGPLGLSAIF